ncbi:glycogen synthase GlgA [candidate division WOR-3 bacterium]|nr:glycogen synthase GlgA [candidate division WOR-3 bacterium]
MKVAFAASEAVPYAKTGGLADVIGTLPQHLIAQGIEVAVFLPRYKGITSGSRISTLSIRMGDVKKVAVYKDRNFYFVDYPAFYDRDGLYGTLQGDYPDNCARFTLFCKAVCAFCEKNNFDLIHCHDWQTGLIPLLLRDQHSSCKNVFTIHNLGYQGRFPRENLDLFGLSGSYFTPDGIEYYGDINLLKSGIVYSDILTTVSENYADEIQTPELGFGLDGILRTRRDRLVGIINGIDYKEWDPAYDPHLYEPFTDQSGKHKNKRHLLHMCGLREGMPVIGMVSRIASQKGFDILMKGFDDIMEQNVVLVILGLGDEAYHRKLMKYEKLFPRRVSVQLKFDNELAHRIYAGSDFFLMPSLYEPCGLGQLISLRYGTVPIVRFTGGLKDTITEYDPETGQGNGFGFTEYTSKELIAAIHRALRAYEDEQKFALLSEKCMTLNYSWAESAKKYKKLYETLLKK